MDKLSFQELNSICDLNIDKKYVIDCQQILKNEECIFESGIIKSREHVAELYSFRYNNANEGGKLSKTNLNDFKNCVTNLNNSKAEFLGVTSIYGANNSFLIFYEPDRKIILGILKSNNLFDLNKLEENQTATVQKGYSSSAEKYAKGKFIRDWK
jgi:hypothetical protein